MSTSLLCAALWLVAANVMALIPSKDNLWQRAYLLIAIGIPLLGWVTYENGPWAGLITLAAGMSVLRWPVVYLGRWAKRLVRRND
jgi:membrane protease YdiL (CAAX protease family)